MPPRNGIHILALLGSQGIFVKHAGLHAGSKRCDSKDTGMSYVQCCICPHQLQIKPINYNDSQIPEQEDCERNIYMCKGCDISSFYY